MGTTKPTAPPRLRQRPKFVLLLLKGSLTENICYHRKDKRGSPSSFCSIDTIYKPTNRIQDKKHFKYSLCHFMLSFHQPWGFAPRTVYKVHPSNFSAHYLLSLCFHNLPRQLSIMFISCWKPEVSKYFIRIF